jgi:predicted small metal-binding protein
MTIMLKFACKDVGVECDFVATGATAEEVKEVAFAHANEVHADILNRLDEAAMDNLIKAVDASIRPV